MEYLSDLYGKTLWELCEEGDVEQVSAALEDGWMFSGEDPNSTGGDDDLSCLMVAAMNGHVSVVEKLLTFPEIEYLACYLASQAEESEYDEEVKALLEAHHAARIEGCLKALLDSCGLGDIISYESLVYLWTALFGSGDGEEEEGCLVSLWTTVRKQCGSCQEEEEEEKTGEEGPGGEAKEE